MPNLFGDAAVRSLLAVILALLAGAPPRPLGAAQKGSPAPSQLHVVVLEGEGASNYARQRAARDPVVRVEDEKRRPVPQATVLFVLPDAGPSGTFGRSARSLLVRTDNAGRAVARGLRANETAGKFQIRAQASFRGTTGAGVITQVNVPLPAGVGTRAFPRKLVAVLAAVGGAAAAGAVVAARRKDAASDSISIAAGTPAVRGPQ